MKTTVYAFESNGAASMGFDDDCLYISMQQQHISFEELRSTALAFRKSGNNGYRTIELAAIKAVHYHEEAPDFFIRFESKPGKLRRHWFVIKDPAARVALCSGLAYACRLLARSEAENRYAYLSRDLLKLAIAGLFTWGACYMSQSGMDSRRVLVQSLSNLLHSIGKGPLLIAGGAVCLLFTVQLLKHLTQSGKTIKYTQS